MRTVKNFLWMFMAFLTVSMANAQEAGQVIDRIIAEVGANVIMQSEIEIEYDQMRKKTGMEGDSLKCMILRQKLFDNIMLSKAQIDSIEISDDRVNFELEKRVRYFASQFPGGEKEMEQVYNKSIAQIKEDNREKIRNSMLIQEVQGKALKDVKVAPVDIKKLFADYTRDSLPFYSAEVELAQIIIEPKVSKEAKQIAFEKISEIRSRIVSGEQFNVLAMIFSEDKGSAVNGGELGYFSRGDMVPEFEAAAFRLKPDSVSRIIETKYGYHIEKLIDRRGEKINVRHILVRPQIFKSDINRSKEFLDSLVFEVKKGTITFEDAAKKYSDDEATKSTGGFISESRTGTHRVPIDELEKEIYFRIESLKAGDISEPELMTMPGPDKQQVWRVFYLKSEMPPHRANLRDDYQKFQAMAQQMKQTKAMTDFLERTRKQVFIRVDGNYRNCPQVATLLQK